MGLPAELSSCPKPKTSPEWLRRNLQALISAENWLSGSTDLKASQQSGEPGLIPFEGSGRDLPGDGACGDSRVAGVSEGLRRSIGWSF